MNSPAAVEVTGHPESAALILRDRAGRTVTLTNNMCEAVVQIAQTAETRAHALYEKLRVATEELAELRKKLDTATAERQREIDFWHPRCIEAEHKCLEAENQRDAALAFEKLVHGRLDDLGVPDSPDPAETLKAGGSRISSRLTWVAQHLAGHISRPTVRLPPARSTYLSPREGVGGVLILLEQEEVRKAIREAGYEST